MKENESIEYFYNVMEAGNIKNDRQQFAYETAIKALEEIQQYRAIGTVERFQQLTEQFKPHITDETSCSERHCNKCDKYRKEAERYQAIGTVEECQEARQKQRARKPKIWTTPDDGVNLIYDMYKCPNCGKEHKIDYYNEYSYCPNCGQAVELFE